MAQGGYRVQTDEFSVKSRFSVFLLLKILQKKCEEKI
jgi:hypothetical protein